MYDKIKLCIYLFIYLLGWYWLHTVNPFIWMVECNCKVIVATVNLKTLTSKLA